MNSSQVEGLSKGKNIPDWTLGEKYLEMEMNNLKIKCVQHVVKCL